MIGASPTARAQRAPGFQHGRGVADALEVVDPPFDDVGRLRHHGGGFLENALVRAPYEGRTNEGSLCAEFPAANIDDLVRHGTTFLVVISALFRGRLADAAEEQAIQVRFVEQHGRRAVEGEPPHFQHQRAIRKLERRAHVLLDHQHGRAAVGQPPQQRHHVLHELGRQPDRRLVDQQHARAQQQRPADLELLLLAARHRRRLVVDALADARKPLQHLLDAGGKLLARQRDAAELQVVPHGQRPEQVAALRHERDAIGEEIARRLPVDALAFEAHLARPRDQHAEQRLQHRRLAGAVGSDQQRDLALPRIQRRLVQDREARRVPGNDLLEFDDLFAHDRRLNFRDRLRAPAGSPARRAADPPPAPCPRPCRSRADRAS